MDSKKQITVRINNELLETLNKKYSYGLSNSELIRLALMFLDMKGGK
jgi:predicted DNA binding CopG/RHH family protein